MRSWRVSIAGTVLASLALACASAGTAGPGLARDLLTREQLDAVDFLNAYEALQRLKPTWLRTERGQDSFVTQGRRGVRVYVDGIYYGDRESLKTLQIQNIEEIRYLDKRQATLEFGTDHGEGALLILTRRR